MLALESKGSKPLSLATAVASLSPDVGLKIRRAVPPSQFLARPPTPPNSGLLFLDLFPQTTFTMPIPVTFILICCVGRSSNILFAERVIIRNKSEANLLSNYKRHNYPQIPASLFWIYHPPIKIHTQQFCPILGRQSAQH